MRLNLRAARRYGLLAVGLVLGLQLAPASAQSPAQSPATGAAAEQPRLADKSLEELMTLEVATVQGASKHSQLVTEAPSSVTIVSAQDIATFGWRTLADVLRSVRGFYVTYDRNYSYVGVRGFARPTDYNNRILVLIDGHRVNDPIYDAAPVGTELPLDLALVDRIEIIRGPGSALYGTSAFFAVVNAVTRRGASLGATQVTMDAGSLGNYRASVMHGFGDREGHDALVSVTAYLRHGMHDLYFPEFDTPETNGGRAFDLDGDRSFDAYAAASTGRWRFVTLLGTRQKDVPTASWGSNFGDSRLHTRDTRGWVEASYRRAGTTGSVDARVSYDHSHYKGIYPQGTLLQEDRGDADWFAGEVTARRTLWSRHAFTAGVEPRVNIRQDQRTYDQETIYVDDRRSSTEIGGYVQDEITLHPRLIATVGARADWWSLKGGTGRPRAGVVYRASYDTAVKVLYGEAYRAPSLYEIYYGDDGSQSRARRETLVPESLRTTELVLEHYVKGRVRLSVSGFETRIRDLIDQIEPDGEGQVPNTFVELRNHERVRSRGLELEAENRWTSGILLRGSYVRQDAIDRTTRQVLSNAPAHLGTLQAAVPLFTRQVQVASDSTYTSSRRTASGTELPGRWLTNVTVTCRPTTSRLTWGVTFSNLFNVKYSDPVGSEFVQQSIQQDGRSVLANVSVRF